MKTIIKEISPIWLLIISIILLILLIGLGFVHLLFKSLYHVYKLRFKKFVFYLVNYWVKVIIQLWEAFKYLCIQNAIAIDMLGNAVCGEAIEDIITAEEDTMFGKGNITISTATGEVESRDKLNKAGVKFSKTLSKLLDENHCIESYRRYLHNKTFKID